MSAVKFPEAIPTEQNLQPRITVAVSRLVIAVTLSVMSRPLV
jgi:hypothetical protein